MSYDPMDNIDSGTLVSDIIYDAQDCMALLVLIARKRSELFTEDELEFVSAVAELVDPILLEEEPTDD